MKCYWYSVGIVKVLIFYLKNIFIYQIWNCPVHKKSAPKIREKERLSLAIGK